jgi:hypothetical protein
LFVGSGRVFKQGPVEKLKSMSAQNISIRIR